MKKIQTIWRRQDLLKHMTVYKFKKMVADDDLLRIRPGIYKYRDSKEPFDDMALVKPLFPDAICSIFTAASYHNLTTVIPHTVQLTLPSSGTRRLAVPEWPKVEFFFTSDNTMSLGMETIEIERTMVKIYNRERTVCDMFRYMNRTGFDCAIEVFKTYMADGRGRNINLLLEYARKLRVYKYISKYVEFTVA